MPAALVHFIVERSSASNERLHEGVGAIIYGQELERQMLRSYTDCAHRLRGSPLRKFHKISPCVERRRDLLRRHGSTLLPSSARPIVGSDVVTIPAIDNIHGYVCRCKSKVPL